MSDTNTTLDEMTDQPTVYNTRLERDPEQRIVAGVAAGLGNRFGVNPWWFRWGFILLTLSGGLGLALYAAGWLLIPQRGHRDSVAVEMLHSIDGRDASTWIGLGLLAVAGLIVLGWIGWLDSALFWATALIVLGVLLYQGDIKISSPPPDPLDDGGDEDVPPPAVTEEALLPSPPAPPKKRSITGPMTFGATLLVLGGMGLADVFGWTSPSFADYVAATLAVFGVGLLAGAFWGKSIAVIVIGVLLVPLLFFARFVPVTISGEFGDVSYTPSGLSDVQSEYSLQAGELFLDLSGIDLDGGTREVRVSVGAGEVFIKLPSGTGLDIEAAVGLGEMNVLGNEDTGVGLTRIVTRSGEGLLSIDARLGAGSLRILQEG